MREIKFRAWNPHTNTMFSSEERFLHIELSGKLVWFTGKSGIGLDAKELILMQYTGLKDKDGKEIYEGDIITFTTQDNWKMIGDVGWKGKWVFGFGIRCSVVAKNPAFFEEELSYLMKASDVMVIGNIYENPELLEGDKGE